MHRILKNYKKRVFIVAEIGNNHEGNFEIAKKLIKKAAECKVDAVKFQTFEPNLFYTQSEKKKIKKLKKFFLSINQFKKLSYVAKKNNIVFFSTPLDLNSAKKLNKFQKIFKIASSDNNYFDLIDLVSKFKKDLIISTGLSDLRLINKIYKLVNKNWKNLKNKPTLAFTHCVSSYPTSFKESNIFTIKELKKKFKNTMIGYSDHVIGNDAALLSVALGAQIVEKHFTLDKNFSKFRDHQLSCDPKDMSILVNRIRDIEKLRKNYQKLPQKSELNTLNDNRRSYAAYGNLNKGTVLDKNNIIGVRPLKGISVSKKKILLNKKLNKNITHGSIIRLRDLK